MTGRKKKRRQASGGQASTQPSPEYQGAQFEPGAAVEAPSYEAALTWMRAVQGPEVSFDIWARGNFTRRLLWNRSLGVQPLLVRVTTVAQMRWAYRRLALVDLPVDFLWAGPISPPGLALQLFPWEMASDAGWGYVAALGDRADIDGVEYFPVMGWGRFMPPEVLEWLLAEAADSFTRGRVFVAPASLVGVAPSRDLDGVQFIADIANGMTLAPSQGLARAITQIELPYLDGLTSQDFSVFLAEHGDELAAFRSAFRRLAFAHTMASADPTDLISELRAHVRELTEGERSVKMRQRISHLGAGFGLFAVGVDVLLGAGTGWSLPLVGAGGAATAALLELWSQVTEKRDRQHPHAYRLLWELGADRAGQAAQPQARIAAPPKPVPRGQVEPFHWLVPPTNGLGFLTARKF